MSDRWRILGTTVTVAVGMVGVTSVVTHALLGPGSLACCSMHPAVEWLLPVVGGIIIGVPFGLTARSAPSEETRSSDPACPACGSVIRIGWRLCPECGNMLGGGTS